MQEAVDKNQPISKRAASSDLAPEVLKKIAGGGKTTLLKMPMTLWRFPWTLSRSLQKMKRTYSKESVSPSWP
ncbi:hypothetical protein BGZ88_000137 [Linnemannia elongata]|nr:hypothetical protein BGZ88_000137 [Linnemannia elongata]